MNMGVEANRAAEAIYLAFNRYHNEFERITRRARASFELRDWRAAQQDAVERLQLYKKVIDQIVAQVGKMLGPQSQDRALWARMKAAYSPLIGCCDDFELAETFFNSVTRRIFVTVGVDPNIEFVDSDFEARPPHDERLLYHIHPLNGQATAESLQAVLQEILGDYPFAVGYAQFEDDSSLAACQILADLQASGALPFSHIEILRPVFYRSTGAFLVGRICRASGDGTPASVIPLVLCLVNTPAGVRLDAVLTDEDEVSIVFSFTRSYFHVEAERPHELIAFLRSILPHKRVAELYISIGYNKHGKTELYRDLIRHLSTTSDRFEIARGERGMVMAVFTMPSYDMVFKIIKDRVDPPKTTSRAEVMERYDLVFRHDRAGRLVDAQEFEHLRFEKWRFAPDLLAELLRVAPSQVTLDGDDCVAIRHLYAERRLTPLNLYLREAGEAAAGLAVIDYGQAIKDLAATNIFPGDVLLKNFGVTRHGRVVFYDYDELCLVTDCKFRKVPPPRSFEDEFESDPWFYVGPLDIFPEEFNTFLGLLEPLRSVYIGHHADLFTVDYWRGIQARHEAGEVLAINPYPNSRRLHPSESA